MKIIRHKIAWSQTDFSKEISIAVANYHVCDQDILLNLQGKPNRSRNRFADFNKLINQICSARCDLAIFPEVCIPFAWLRWLTWIASNRQIGFVIGLEHCLKDKYALNHIATILPFRSEQKYNNCHVSLRQKRHYSPKEIEEIEGRYLKVPDTRQPYDLFKWKGASFAVFNCFELTNISERALFRAHIDFLVCCEYNSDINYFSNIIESASRDLHCYVIQVNASQFGDSRIVAPKKSELRDMVQIKGGENQTFLKARLNLQNLREHQLLKYSLQTRSGNFKPTPAGWNPAIVKGRIRQP